MFFEQMPAAFGIRRRVRCLLVGEKGGSRVGHNHIFPKFNVSFKEIAYYKLELPNRKLLKSRVGEAKAKLQGALIP